MATLAPSVELVAENLRDKLDNPEALAERYKDRAFREYYGLLVEETVAELLSIPVDRICLGLHYDPSSFDTSDLDDVTLVLADFFDKDPESVASDITKAVAVDKNNDFRLAKLYRYQNKLH